MDYLIIWLVCGGLSAVIGAAKGRGFLGFFLGVLLGPLGILAMLIIPGNRKVCYYCKSHIHKDAIVCPKCGKNP